MILGLCPSRLLSNCVFILPYSMAEDHTQTPMRIFLLMSSSRYSFVRLYSLLSATLHSIHTYLATIVSYVQIYTLLTIPCTMSLIESILKSLYIKTCET